MLLPTTYAAALLLTFFSLLCWGSWANTFKLDRRWRFELYYFDFAIGMLATAVLAGMTLGSMGDELSFADNLGIAAKRQMAVALLTGVVVNLGIMLLLGAISISGMATSFSISLSVALAVAVLWSASTGFSGSLLLLIAGTVLVLGASITGTLASRANAQTARLSGWKGVFLSIASGLLLGTFFPLMAISQAGDYGLRPYSAIFLFAIGAFFSTFPYAIYFINLPVSGEAVGFSQYFRGKLMNHFMGFAGGTLWTCAAIANLAAAAAPPEVRLGPALGFFLTHAALVLCILWGVLVWKEFRGATTRGRMLIALTGALYLAGLGMLSVAPSLSQAVVS